MFEREESVRERPGCVVECEARIVAEEAAMTHEEKEARLRRIVLKVETKGPFTRKAG